MLHDTPAQSRAKSARDSGRDDPADNLVRAHNPSLNQEQRGQLLILNVREHR